MKSKPFPFFVVSRRILLAASAFSITYAGAWAGSLTWDGNGATTPNPNGGAGTWDADTTASWWDGSSNVKWSALTGTDNDALFANTAGTVSIAAPGVTANDLTFSTTNYIVQDNTLTLIGTTPTITTTGTTTIKSKISGTAGLKKDGTGTLVLTGANDYTSGTTISGGTLQIGDGMTNGTYNGPYTINANTTLSYLATTSTLPNSGNLSNITGSGTLSLTTSRANSGATNSWGSPGTGFPAGFTGTMQVERGRLYLNTTLGGATAVVIKSGAQGFMNVAGASFSQNFTVEGTGYGEGGYESALRLETATLNGTVTLSGDATLAANSAGTATLNNTVSGAFNLTLGTNNSAGTMLLKGTNTYTGSTIIAKGTLQIGGSGSLGSGNYAGNITNSGSFVHSSSVNQILSGVMSGAGAVTKSSSATLILTGANTYSGTTTISSGTLEIGGSGKLGNGSYAAAITDNGSFLHSSSADLLLSGVISGTGSLTKSGSAILTLSNANTYSGPTNINGGTLNLTGSLANSALSVADGKKLSGEGSAASLVLGASAGGGELTADPTTTGAFSVTGAATVNGPLAVRLQTGAVPLQSFKVLSFGSNGNNFTASQFSLANPASFRSGYSFTVNPNDVTMTLVGKRSLEWSGATNSTWDLGTTVNFRDTNTLAPDKYYDGDDVLLGNLPAANQTITISGDVAPASVTMNSALNYSLTGGAIAGTASVTKLGSGTLTLSGVNTYTGAVSVNAGILTSAAGSTTAGSFLGAPGTAANRRVVNIASGAQVNYTNPSGFNNFLNLGGNVATGGYGSFHDFNISGTLSIYDGIDISQILQSTFNLSNGGVITTNGTGHTGNYGLLFGWSGAGGGNINVSGTGNQITADRIGFFNGATITTAAGADLTISSIVKNGAATATAINKDGSGLLTLTGANIHTGATTVTGGTLALAGGAAIYDAGSVILANTAGVQLLLNASETIGSLSGGGSIGGNVNLQDNTLTVSNTTNPTFAGSLTGNGGLTKAGSGTLTLSGASSYSGPTLVSAGTLNLTGSLANSALTVDDNMLVSGNGSAAAITLGTSGGADLIVSPTSGELKSTGGLTVNGSTYVHVTGTLPQADFKILSFVTKANAFDPSNFTLANPSQFRPDYSFEVNANNVTLHLDKKSLEWTGGSDWDLGTTANFRDTTTLASESFYTGDEVLFGDTPAGNQTIAIIGALAPTSVTVNSALDYTFNGPGTITGAIGLTKSGTGTLTLSGTGHTFTGATVITGGTVGIAADGSLGTAPAVATPGQITFNGGTLKWNNKFDLNGNRGIALGANGATLDTTIAAGNGNINIPSLIAGNGTLTLKANGDTSDTGGGAGGSTRLTNTGNSFAGTVIIKSGVVTTTSNFGDAANTLILDGGGVVDENANTNFTRNLQIGAAGGVYRTFGGVSTGALAGAISNAPGVASTTLRRTDNGTAWISGDMSGFSGQFQNKRGNLRISAADANWSNTDYIQDSAGGWVEFRGGGTTTIKSISSTRDVLVNYGTAINVASGAISMATNGHWWKNDAGSAGSLTSSSGTLTVTNGTASSTLETLDHQIRVPLVNFNGSTPLALVKNGANLLVLNQANTFSGGTTINGGRIQPDHLQAFGSGSVTVNNGGQAFLTLAGTYANNFSVAGNGVTEGTSNFGAIRFNNGAVVSGSVTVAAAGARITAHNGAVGTLTGTLLGSGNLELNSSAASNNGTLNLNGSTAAYTGALTLSQGRLNLNSTNLGGSLVIADGTTLSTEASAAGAVTLAATATGMTLVVDAGTPAALTSGGAMTVNGNVNVNLSGVVPAGNTPIKVLGFASKAGTWDATKFVLPNAANYRSGTGFSETANAVELTIPTADLTWTGAVNNTWDTNNTANFQDTAPSSQKFYWSDRVAFGDLTGTATTITVSGTVQPGAMTVNSPDNLTFSGGTIAGTGSLTKSGAGTLTLSGTNSYTGATAVNAGTLNVGTSSVSGTFPATSPITLGTNGSSAATLNHYFGSNVTLASLTVASGSTGTSFFGGATAANQSVTVNSLTLNAPLTTGLATGTGQNTIIQFNNISGAAAAGTDALIFSNQSNANGVIQGNSNNGGLSYTGNAHFKTGSNNTFQLQNFTGGVNAGIFSSTTDVVIDSGVTLKMNNSGAYTSTFTFNALIGSGTWNNGSASGQAITLSMGNGDGSGSFSGLISNTTSTTSVIKNGSGTQTFTGASTYSGTTTINGGTLLVTNTTGSGTGTGAITVNANGSFGGTGSVSGAITVNASGTIAPGTTGAGTLTTGAVTLSGTYACQLDGANSDKIASTGSLTLTNATLAISTLNTPTATSYTIATFTGATPSFTTVTGLPAGYAVDSSTAGQIKLVKTGSGYGSWAAANAPTGTPAQDFDGDGVSNALEWILGGLATTNDLAKLPTVSTSGGNLVFTFVRNDEAWQSGDTTTQIQVGTTLATWPNAYNVGIDTASSSPGVTVTDNGTTDTVRLTIPMGADAKKFARLKATVTP